VIHFKGKTEKGSKEPIGARPHYQQDDQKGKGRMKNKEKAEVLNAWTGEQIPQD